MFYHNLKNKKKIKTFSFNKNVFSSIVYMSCESFSFFSVCVGAKCETGDLMRKK